MKYNKYPSDYSQYLSFLNTASFAVFFLLLPLVYSHQVFETASIPRHILISGFACLILLIFSFQIFTNNIDITYSHIHLSLFVFLLWALLSSLWSKDIYNSVTELTQLVLYFIIAFSASQLKYNHIKIILNAVYISAIIAAALGILQAFHFNPLELKMTTPLASTFNNKNHASVYFDLVIPLALVSMLTNKHHEKIIASIAYTFALTFILLAKTKGSLLAFIIFTLFFFIIIYKNKSIQTELFTKKYIIQYLFLTLFIPVLIYALATASFSSLTTSVPKQWNAGLTKQSNSIRLSWYKNAYAMLKDHPITGVGYGAFRQGFAPYASKPNVVKSLLVDQAVSQLHNDPYQFFLELGLVGGGIIVIIFSFIVFRALRILTSQDLRNKGSPDYVFLGVFLALISCITHSLVDFPMRLPSSAALFWFLTGLSIIYITNSTLQVNNKTAYIKKITGVILITLTMALLIHSYDLYSRYFTASKLTYNASVSYIKNKNCKKAKNEIDQAIDLFFEDAFIRQRYVQVYSSCTLPTDLQLAAMNKVLTYDATNTRARMTRGVLNLNKRKLHLAEIDFSYVTSVLPHQPIAYLGLGDIATLKKDFTAARHYYQAAIDLDPDNKKANFMIKQFDNKGI